MTETKTPIGVALLAVALLGSVEARPVATSKSLGGVTTAQMGTRYLSYWNEIVPSTECTWGAVEVTRGRFTFQGMDALRKSALANGLKYRIGPLVSGNHQPSWVNGLSATDALADLAKWMDSLAVR